ncbi:glycosyltransferase family 117 protein [Reichenbachiella sp.]
MSDYNKLNNITGWIIFILATTVYALTVEPTASFWDCGEFIAVSYKLEVPHPPGAPFFLLLGRLFSFLAMGDVTQVAYWINMLSVLSSGFTVLFLFWSITHLAKKLVTPDTSYTNFVIIGSGLIGALSYTFSDSFWFSAVEAEVYGMSSFFTAFVVWAMLKWENIKDPSDENRWMILIAYMVGLSIGVHLLNLVTLPALGLIYYFKKREKLSTRGIITTLLASGVIVLIIMEGVIPGLPSLAGKMEIFFVNNLGLPFGSGIIFFAAIFIGGLVYGIFYSIKSSNATLNTILVSFAFIVIGYSSYSIVLIRSNYNPPIDENNPEDVLSFVSYLKREQYGSRPLLHGQVFTADIVDQKKGAPVYTKGEEKYEITDHKLEYIYDPEHTTILPRAYSNQPGHVQRYREILGLKNGEKPSFADNLAYMFKHQLGTMYFRYFMWNFAGRASDIQGADWVGLNDAFEKVPPMLEENKGRNIFFMIPLILGIIGLTFQYYKDPRNFAFVGLLFFLTGAAIVLYLNSPPTEPRERDYIYAGSYYAYAFWIGIGFIAIFNGLMAVIKKGIPAAAIALVICLSAPIIMASEGWDDHDRSNRYFSVDSAKNFLASCEPNAIIFTGGDNDTFPLWYVQEVEGFRTDVRVIVLSYFNTDWYIAQMMRDAYESKPLPFGLTLDNYKQGGLNDYLPLVERQNIKGGTMNAAQFIKLIKEEHPALAVPTSISSYNSVPAKNFYLPIDSAKVMEMGIIPEQFASRLSDRMTWSMKGRGLEKKDLAILDLIVNNNWERPIYFNNTSASSVNFNLKDYMVQEGNAFRLLPIKSQTSGEMFVNTDIMFDNMIKNFHWRELDNPTVYYSEDYRNFVLNHRASFNTLIENLLAEGKTEKAREALMKCLEFMPDNVIRYDHFSVQQVGYLILVGEEEKAIEMAELISQRSDEMLTYLYTTGNLDRFELQKNLISLSELARTFRGTENLELASKYEELFRKHYELVQ